MGTCHCLLAGGSVKLKLKLWCFPVGFHIGTRSDLAWGPPHFSGRRQRRGRIKTHWDRAKSVLDDFNSLSAQPTSQFLSFIVYRAYRLLQSTDSE